MPDIIGDQSRPRLHVRTVLGAAGSPAAGKTGYLYRLDLTKVIGALDVSCATALKLDVGPTAKFEYFKNGANADLFVIDKGGAGTIGVSKAERIADCEFANWDAAPAATWPQLPKTTTSSASSVRRKR